MADDLLLTLAADIGLALKQRGWMLALAESCTGGMAAQFITAIPGSSAWFDRGFVTYSNAAKIDMLHVSQVTLDQYGAVSEETAREMALGACQYSQAQISGASTGIAGPGGGTDGKPVGMVCFAWATKNGLLVSTTSKFDSDGDRETIRQQATTSLLQGLLNQLNQWT